MIYICIPTHNEQQTVGVVLWKLRQVFTEFPRDYQLLVADDASTDKTIDVLEPYTRVLPLTVIRSERRQGYAASLEMLLREAVRRSEYPKRDVIVTLQADFSEEPDNIVDLIKRMEAGADVAVGIKATPAGETRLRRLARSLSRFFTRRQSWPEGVETPFDGYRAYRLYAVRKAMDERGGRRLIRYDGWAGHAELLRAVLPHARRVEAVSVEDRTDRLQRPRREKPFASAWEVRAMAGGAEPTGLLGVDELDRTAATASRSRERSAALGNGDGRSTVNGTRGRRQDATRGRSDAGRRGEGGERGAGRDRGSRGERETRRGASAEGGARTAGGGRKREGAAARADRPARTERSSARQDRSADRPERAAGGQRRRGERPERPERPERGPKPPAAGDEQLPLLGVEPDTSDGVSEAAAAGEAGTPPKKRRRRRRSRSGGADAAQQSLDTGAESPGVTEAEAGDEGGDDAEGGESEGGAKKRRRRGGRRGGRGRRRSGAADGTATGEAPVGGEAALAGSTAPQDGGGQDPAPMEAPAREPAAQQRDTGT